MLFSFLLPSGKFLQPRPSCPCTVLFTIFLIVHCNHGTSTVEVELRNMASSSSSLRVLFIGNSFTYANDLDQVFTLFMHSRGIGVEAKRVAKGGYSFAQHLKDLEKPEEELYSLLGEGSKSAQRWDYVILQVSCPCAVMLSFFQPLDFKKLRAKCAPVSS